MPEIECENYFPMRSYCNHPAKHLPRQTQSHFDKRNDETDPEDNLHDSYVGNIIVQVKDQGRCKTILRPRENL